MIRRRFIAIVMSILAGVFASVVRGDTPTATDAIASGLGYLAEHQNADGSFASDQGRFSETSLALVAFLSTGNTADGGRYATNVRRAVDYLVRQAPADRDFGAADASGAAGQATVILSLCQAYGVEPDDATRMKIRAVVKDALAHLLKGKQETERYSDALRAASRMGLSVPAMPATRATTTQGDDSEAEILLSHQLPDGSWPATGAPASDSRIHETADAIFRLGSRSSLMPSGDK